MSESKFTPGPWHVGGTFDPDSDHPTVNVWGPTPDGLQSGRIIANRCAPYDARLIARAPTMHAVLLECLEYFEKREDASNEGDGWRGNEEMKLAGVIREALGEKR